MDDRKTIEILGFTMASPAYMAGVVVFSIIRWAAYRNGKKVSNNYTKWIGIALTLYPYAVSETGLMYARGTGTLCVSRSEFTQ